MISVLFWAFAALCLLLLFYLLLPLATTVLAEFSKKSHLQPGPKKIEKDFDFGCVITCYKNADIARPLVESLLRQSHQKLAVYLVADECPRVEWTFDDPRFVLLQPDPPLRLKAKSIIHAMENFQKPHDFTVVFDGDNLAHPDFLKKIEGYAQAGWRTIQGQRTAKNLDTRFAAMDSLGEFFKNWVERVAPFRLGSSSVISGSGMAVETDLYWDYLRSPEIEQGKTQWKKMLQEDKILQNFLLRRRERIAYAWDAVCFDEKITTGDAAQTQRARWLFSYFQNLPNALGIVRRGFFGLNWNQLFFGLVTLGLPMFILLGASFLMMVAAFFISKALSAALFLGLAGYIGGVLLALYFSKVPTAVWSAIWSLPAFAWRQFLGLFKMANPNKNFKHTEVGRAVSIEEVLKK